MDLSNVPALVLRPPAGPSVAHQLLCVPPESGRAVACLLAQLKPAFGRQPASGVECSIGVSYAGLEALGLPESYLRVFSRLAPAFAQGAVRRSARLGDSGDSAAPRWAPEFQQQRAHVLISWHGSEEAIEGVKAVVRKFRDSWAQAFGTADSLPQERTGKWLEGPPPPGQEQGHSPAQPGQWVHFGYRDGLSEVCIEKPPHECLAADPRHHAAGALVLGAIDDAGSNRFALSAAPDKVRRFFHDSSFGILRPMAQDLAAFEEQVTRWVAVMSASLGRQVTRDFVKAKLCGRWPDGRVLQPGEWEPAPSAPLKLDLMQDLKGEGCPFGAHVRRMQATHSANGEEGPARPLQRRGVPFGDPHWDPEDLPSDGKPRGLLGHFFCASIEDQFEHLLGQWSARPPLGRPAADSAQDPLIGPHDDPQAALLVPVQGEPDQILSGMRSWTTTLGTMYAWYPGKLAWKALLDDDFVPKEDEGPWL